MTAATNTTPAPEPETTPERCRNSIAQYLTWLAENFANSVPDERAQETCNAVERLYEAIAK
jgi:hypothetical protein